MARGFDEFYGTVANTTYYNPPQFIDSRASPDVDPVEDPNFYTTDAYRDRAIDYIGQQRAGQPYFLYFPFNAQHGPLQPAAPKKYMDRFPNIKDQKRKEFAGAMAALDDGVGAVLQKVRDMGQEENTLVIFFSDNGGPTWQTTASNLPLHGSKGTTSEGGTRIPFCMQWKGKIPPGKVFEHPIQNLDVLPTALAAAGGKFDPAWNLDGVDLMPYITGANAARPHEVLYWRFGDQWAIRQGDWKLVVSNADRADRAGRANRAVSLKPRLINLRDDISEANDLSDKNPEKLKELQALYQSWSAQQHEPLWGSPNNARPKKKAKN
jgi:arylsulfatase A-like enzyme